MSAPDRDAYAARQAQLLDALLRGEQFPAGFVAADARAAGAALRRKRGRAVARTWPALALSLGHTFDARFDTFTRDGAGAAAGNPRRDGLAFARWLQGAGVVLGDDVRVEVLLARSALRRRSVWLRVARLRHPSARLVVVARLPFAGTVHRSVPVFTGKRRRAE